MTVIEMAKLVDHTGWMSVEEFTIEVMIKDVRVNFGETQVLVAPVQGKGQKWTPLHRVVLIGGV